MGVPLFGQEHVDRYRETDGEEGHDWQGTTVLLLTTSQVNRQASRQRAHGVVVSVPVPPVSEAASTVHTCDGSSWHSA